MNKIENILKCLIENLEEGIHIVDAKGKTIYYNASMGRVEGLNPCEVIGKKVNEYLKDVKEESSTLMNAIKKREKYTDVIQHYSSHYGKKVTTINTTIPVFSNNEVIAAVEISKNMTQLKELNEKICRLQLINSREGKHFSFNDIIGVSDSIKKAINKAMRASLSNSSVLMCGETGSGKEVFAQSIHYSGTRKDKPFIPINCAAIPSALLEGMLFGTVKGSFTGAENKKGLFEEASGGTILLDEINSMEPALQSKLLRVLQEGYVRPVGSSTTIDVDVRILATLNEEPEKLIKEGRLRKDFYYRLSVIRIDIPPLRDRKEDIKPLVNNFIEYYNGILGKDVSDLEEEVYKNFMEHDWPGNVRELKNLIESAMNMVDSSRKLTKEYFENKSVRSAGGEESNYNSGIDALGELSLEDYLDNVEKKIIEETLRKYDNNISKSAQHLKMTRQNLQYKIKKYGLL